MTPTGLAVSHDRGVSWKPLNVGAACDLPAADPWDPDVLYIACVNTGTMIKVIGDEGTQYAADIKQMFGWDGRIWIPVGSSELWLIGDNGFGSCEVYRSQDDGRTWTG